jgi:hypothetical protein
VSDIGRRLFVLKSISLENQVEGVALLRVVVVEQVEQVAVVEVLLNHFFIHAIFIRLSKFDRLQIHSLLVYLTPIYQLL